MELTQVVEDDPDLAPHRFSGQALPDTAYNVSIYHLDHLGTPRVLTHADGTWQSTHHYLPFGEEISPPPSTNTHQFTGHERDRETGLDYMFARYYGSSNIMRFLSVDPDAASVKASDPQSWNRYSYTLNNPVKYVDPNGQDIVLGSDTNKGDVKKMLVQTAMRPTGRGTLQKLDSDPKVTVTISPQQLNSPEELQKAEQEGGEVDPGSINLESVEADAAGEHLNLDMALDPAAIALTDDPTGVTTVAHELYHANDYAAGKSDEEIKAGDKPTSATGPAEQFGKSVAKEKPDISKKQAKQFVKEIIKKNK